MVNMCWEYVKEGKMLFVMVFVGLDNFMGLYVIYIGRLYVIYGININFGIGFCVSQGCICLCNDDIKYLFDYVFVGVCVQIIDRFVKFLVELDGSCWLEVYELFFCNCVEFELDKKVLLFVMLVLCMFIKGDDVDILWVNEVLECCFGMLVNISVGRSGF